MITWAYIAGFFDGEGHVGEHQYEKNGYRSHCATIVQAYPQQQILYEIRNFLKEHGIETAIYWQERKPPRNKCGTLAITHAKNLAPFYRGMMPWLSVKKKQAQAALESAQERLDHTKDFNARLKKATKAYLAGHGMRAIFEKFGLNKMRFKEHLISQGIHVRSIVEGKAISLIEKTPSFQKRRAENGKFGAQTRWANHEPKGKLKKAIIADYESGFARYRVARKYRISGPTLVRYFNKWGVHNRNYSEGVKAALRLRDTL